MNAKVRNVLMVLIGVAVLLWKGRYSGPAQELIRGYAGNVSVSFAVYFNAALLNPGGRFHRLRAAILALAAVELFEATGGFGFMSNTYDPWDYLANLAGVALGIGIDTILPPGRSE